MVSFASRKTVLETPRTTVAIRFKIVDPRNLKIACDQRIPADDALGGFVHWREDKKS